MHVPVEAQQTCLDEQAVRAFDKAIGNKHILDYKNKMTMIKNYHD
jgi:hypothetical protein